MSQIYSAQLYLEHQPTDRTLVVPEDRVWVIRTITLFYAGSVADQWVQLVLEEANATLYKHDTGIITGSVMVIENDLRIVVEPGQTLHVTGSGDADVGFFGYSFALG